MTKADLIDSSKRGVWALTEKGRAIGLTPEVVARLFKEVHANFPTKQDRPPALDEETETPPPTGSEEGSLNQPTLLDTLKSLTPDGFERIAQRLLRESGFERVVVTGRSGDGGIDGHGILQVNPFVSFKVLFQCKRYSGTVSASQVRDFRGAMMGRADKGIIITTGTFTTEATKEARRDGAPPIELVDGETLKQMFEKLELGVKPKTVYEVDASFFEEYSGEGHRRRSPAHRPGPRRGQRRTRLVVPGGPGRRFPLAGVLRQPALRRRALRPGYGRGAAQVLSLQGFQSVGRREMGLGIGNFPDVIASGAKQSPWVGL
jgi:restriction system protein